MNYKNIRIALAATLVATLVGLAFIPAARAESITVWPVTDQYGNQIYDTYGNSCVFDRYGYLYVMDRYYQLYPARAYACRAYTSYPSTNAGGGYNNYSYQDKSSEISSDFSRRQTESLKSTACIPYCDEVDSYDDSGGYGSSYGGSSYGSSYDSGYDDED